MSAVAVTRRFSPAALTGGVHAGRRTAWVLVGLLGVLTLVALLAHVLAPADPIQPVGGVQLPIGTPGHLLGTDSIGRDVLSRTL